MTKSRKSLIKDYEGKTPLSRSQWQKGLSFMPGGVIKGAYWSDPYPTYIAKAEGCYIWDIDNNQYVDFGNHHSAMILGHNDSVVVEAVEREIHRGFGLGGPIELELEISREIINRFPSVNKVRFCNSGTEAAIHVARMVRAITGRTKLAKFEGAYHGSTDSLEVSTSPSLEKAGPANSPYAVSEWPGMPQGSEEDLIILPYSDRESVEIILRENRDEIAGVFYDARPGIIEVSGEFTRFIRDITKELGIPMVMDEVVSFRSGPGGAQGLFGIEPDITMFGKAFGGGFPIGAIGGKDEFMQILDNSSVAGVLNQSGTFSGNSFTLAAGLATLKRLSTEVYDHIDSLRQALHDGLVQVFEQASLPNRVLSAGAGLQYYLTDQPVTDYRAVQSLPNSELAERIELALFLKGFSMRGGIGITLSAPMTPDHITDFLSALEETLQEK